MSNETRWGFPVDQDNALAAAYKASQPPQIQALMLMDGANLPSGVNPKMAQAQALSNQGFAIDAALMVFGWDILPLMWERGGYQMVTKADGITVKDLAGVTDLVVSTDPNDFPPFPIPPVPTQPSDTYIDRPYSVPWGPTAGGGTGASWYVKTPALSLADGTTMSHDYQGKTYQLRLQLKPTPVWIQISE